VRLVVVDVPYGPGLCRVLSRLRILPKLFNFSAYYIPSARKMAHVLDVPAVPTPLPPKWTPTEATVKSSSRMSPMSGFWGALLLRAFDVSRDGLPSPRRASVIARWTRLP
jgi:hypothetical protein